MPAPRDAERASGEVSDEGAEQDTDTLPVPPPGEEPGDSAPASGYEPL